MNQNKKLYSIKKKNTSFKGDLEIFLHGFDANNSASKLAKKKDFYFFDLLEIIL